MTATVFISSAHKINVRTSKISPCFCHSFSFIWGKRHVSLNPVPGWVPPPIFCVLTESRHTFRTFKITFTNILDFPGGSDGEESACNVGDPGLIPGSGRCPGERNGYPLQYSCLKNSMDRGAWQRNPWGCIKSDTTGQLTLSLFQIWCLWFLWVWCSVVWCVCVCVCTHTHTHMCFCMSVFNNRSNFHHKYTRCWPPSIFWLKASDCNLTFLLVLPETVTFI